MRKLLLTCPHMIKSLHKYPDLPKMFDITVPDIEQTLPEAELIRIIPEFDAWIAGDDPATRAVFSVAKKLKCCIKWGVGTDNIDLQACKDLNIKTTNTPNVFGNEVADVAIGYLINLTRQLTTIDKQVHQGIWYKPCGVSLAGKTACIIGYGNVGKQLERKLPAFDIKTVFVDPFYKDAVSLNTGLAMADIIFLCCELNATTRHIINADSLLLCKKGIYIINVARGALVDESAIIASINLIGGFATDVFETEPLPKDSPLKQYSNIILGSHNASHTDEAVERASTLAIQHLLNLCQ